MEMWIAADELDLLDAIFEPEELIPRNQKGNFKLRHISFFNTGAKAITNIVNYSTSSDISVVESW